MTALYSDLPLQSYTLQSFVDYADLVRDQKGPQEFIRFVLTNEVPGERQYRSHSHHLQLGGALFGGALFGSAGIFL